MYTLCIGLGYSVFACIMQPFSEYSDLFSRIKQHRIILSNSLVEYYLSLVPDQYEDNLLTFIDSIIGSEELSISFKDDPNLDARQNLINFVLQVPLKTLITDEDEFKAYKLGKVNQITPLSIVTHENNNFNRYTFPITHYIASKGENCLSYSAWFGHLFENESTITIIDQYIFQWSGRESLKKFYLPKISEGTRIDVYCEFDKCGFDSEEELMKMIEEEFSSWDMHVFLCDGMHDRYILLDSIQISLGTGLVFLNRKGTIVKDCNICITNDTSIPFPHVIKCLC